MERKFYKILQRLPAWIQSLRQQHVKELLSVIVRNDVAYVV